jgi:hypothetical protein
MMDKNPRDPVQWQGECLVFWKLKNLVGVLPFQGIAVAAPYANRRTNISWSHHGKGFNLQKCHRLKNALAQRDQYGYIPPWG